MVYCTNLISWKSYQWTSVVLLDYGIHETSIYILHRPNKTDVWKSHDDVIKWKHFHFTGYLWGEFTGHQWAHKHFVTRVHIWLYFLHDKMNPKMTLKTRIFTHHPHVSLARFALCWRLAMMSQWPDLCDADTWQMISNSLDIDFIHGDIHERSCKNMKHWCTQSWIM